MFLRHILEIRNSILLFYLGIAFHLFYLQTEIQSFTMQHDKEQAVCSTETKISVENRRLDELLATEEIFYMF